MSWVRFTIVPKGLLQSSRRSLTRWEYWAIWSCSYHSYWTVALIAVRVQGGENLQHEAMGKRRIHCVLTNIQKSLHAERLTQVVGRKRMEGPLEVGDEILPPLEQFRYVRVLSGPFCSALDLVPTLTYDLELWVMLLMYCQDAVWTMLNKLHIFSMLPASPLANLLSVLYFGQEIDFAPLSLCCIRSPINRWSGALTLCLWVYRDRCIKFTLVLEPCTMKPQPIASDVFCTRYSTADSMFLKRMKP